MNDNRQRSKRSQPLDFHIGRKLREFRKLRGLTQQELGQKLARPISYQQVQKYEKGISRVSASHLWEFSEALNVSLPSFFPHAKIQLSLISETDGDLSALPRPLRRMIKLLIKEMAHLLNP